MKTHGWDYDNECGKRTHTTTIPIHGDKDNINKIKNKIANFQYIKA